MEPDISPELPEDQLSQEVVAELKRRYAVQNGVPQSVDSAVLADAERHLNSIFRASTRPNSARRFAWVAASAGSLLAVVLLVLLTPWSAENERPDSQVASREFSESPADSDRNFATQDTLIAAASAVDTGDVDGNGLVDIRDAFAVARAIQAGHTTVPEWDRNGDGKVDGADVDLIALTAVTL